MLRHFVNIVLGICLSTAVAIAADYTVKGRVVDAVTNQPLDFADVLLFELDATNPSYNVLPKTDGSFVIEGVKEGTYSLVIRLVGYDLFTKAGVVLSASTPTVNVGVIKMQPLEVGLSEVEVVANKKQVIYKLDKRVIEASSNMLASGGTAVDILENTPSIRVDAEGEVTFRGSSGFTVYIDGKPSIFSGTQALEQVPSGQIENIEIITTPSARHDVDGDVGIINIITKKNFGDGFSGMANISGSTYLTHNADLLLNWVKKRHRFFVSGTWTNVMRKSDFEADKTTIVDDRTTRTLSEGPRESDRHNYSMKLGYVYSLPKTTFNIDFEGGQSGNKRLGDLNYEETITFKDQSSIEDSYYSHDKYNIYQYNLLGNVGIAHKFNDKGHNISASYYMKHEADAIEYFSSDLYNAKGERQHGHRSWEDEVRWTIRGNLDYVLPYSETGKIEAGYQYYSYLEDGDYSMQWWSPEQQDFYYRDDIYNTFYFQEGINSVYAIVGDSYKAFDFQVGIRGEHSHRVLRTSIEDKNREFNKFEWFPSAHIGYTLPGDHKLQAAYSRRITRARLHYMEPYITYRDYYSAEIGNPDVRSEYIHSFELNYKKDIGEHSISATAFHRFRKDKIERLRIPYEAGVTLDSMANVGNDYSTGIELSGQVKVTPWWNVTLNGSLYHYKVKNKLQEYGTDEKSTNYDIIWNNGFDLGKYTRIQLDGNFVGPSVVTQGRTDAFWYVNLAVRQQMFNRKLTATLSFRDVFNSARYVSTITTAGLESVTHIRPKYPNIMLTLSYTFNNFKAKSTQSTTTHDLFEGTNH